MTGIRKLHTFLFGVVAVVGWLANGWGTARAADGAAPAPGAQLDFVEVRGGLPNAAAKLAAGQPLTVVFIGGSVTEGGRENGYVAGVGRWLKEAYPASAINVVNAGIGGTNSKFGSQRYERDVLAEKPDLVLIEFAVNDDGDAREWMERLVRKTWTRDPQTDIAFMYHAKKEFLPTYAKGELPAVAAFHEQVAAHYQIPSVNTGAAVGQAVNANAESWEALFGDVVHPKPADYAIYTKTIVAALQQVLAAGNAGSHALGETLIADLAADAPTEPAEPMAPTDPVTDAAGAKAEATYALPIFGLNWTDQPEFKDGGQVRWRLATLPTTAGMKLTNEVGLLRSERSGAMQYFPAARAFTADHPKAQSLAAKAEGNRAGSRLGAKDKALGVLSFIAPANGRYVVSATSDGVTLWSHHKAIALYVIHFTGAADVGKSIAFASTDSDRKAGLNITAELQMQAGDELAFQVDTNADGGGGGAYWEGMSIRIGRFATADAGATAPAAGAAAPVTYQPLTIDVDATPRQRFGGFGASLINDGSNYGKLPAAARAQLNDALWRDLGFNTLRLWIHLDTVSPERGTVDVSGFIDRYLTSGMIRDAQASGATTLLLAPSRCPSYMTEPREAAPDKVRLKESETDAYAVLLADTVTALRDGGVSLDATGLQNEPNDPVAFTPTQLAGIVKRLRSELDRRGLTAVKIIAPENANADGHLLRNVDAMRQDAEAWNALHAIASHTYNMGPTAAVAERVDGQRVEYWQTEASDNGPEAPGDHRVAASLASRVLSDLNHGVHRWIHFIGYERVDPRDNATRIFAYESDPFRLIPFEKAAYYGMISRALPIGSTIFRCRSSADEGMAWTYGHKPRVSAVAARQPDGKWTVMLSNFTSDFFTSDQATAWQREQMGRPAESYEVTVRFAAATDGMPQRFRVHRRGPGSPGGKTEDVVIEGNELRVRIRPLELITLAGTAQ